MKNESPQRKVPELRFKGFHDDWEQHKIETVLEERNEAILPSIDFPLMSFTSKDGVVEKTERYDRSFLVKNHQKKYKKTMLGDIIYSSNNLDVGAIGINKTGNAVISPVYSVFKLKKEAQNDFISNLIKRKSFLNQMLRFRQGVVYGQWKIKENDFINIKIFIPSFNEQTKISKLLFLLDDAIILHQRKWKNLKKVKKVHLLLILPGLTLPKKRFIYANKAWEQLKFNSFINRLNRRETSSKEIPFVEYEDIISDSGCLNKDIYKKSGKKSGIFFEKNNVLFGKLRPYLNNWLNPNFKGIAVGDFWVLESKKVSSDFIYFLIQSPGFSKIANQTSGTKMPRSDWKKISNTLFFIPTDISEENKISSFFKSLDSLIELEHKKIKLLKKLKQAYLQKLFI